MAITITVAELAESIRVGSTTREQNEVSRLRDYAIVAISTHLGAAYDTASEIAVNMATSLLTGYYYDKPTVSGGVGLANAIKFSGAIKVLLPYKIFGAGLVGGDAIAAAQAAIGTGGGTVVGVDIVGTELVVTFADGTEERHALPAGGGGGGVLSVDDGALPAAPVKMRIAWAQPGDVINAALFGAASNEGMTDRTVIPYFPVAYTNAGTVTGNVIFWAATDLIPAELPLGFEVVGAVRTALEIQGESGWYWSTITPITNGYGGVLGSYEGVATAFVLPGLLIATQDWVNAQIANIMLSGGGITTAQAQALIDAAVVGFQTDAQVSAIVAAALTTLPDYQTLTEVNTLITAAIAALTPGQTAAQVAALITLHAAMPNIHHVKTPEGGGGGGDPVMLGTATAVGTPIQIGLSATEADAVIAAYNAGTYPGGYRMTLVWVAGVITHGVESTLPADLFGTLVNGRNYYFHIDAVAALDASVSRYLSLGRVPAQDNVQIVSLPTGR